MAVTRGDAQRRASNYRKVKTSRAPQWQHRLLEAKSAAEILPLTGHGLEAVRELNSRLL